MRSKRVVSVLAVLALLAINLFVFVQPASACIAGCTPGYWKQEQHFGNWYEYTPDYLVVDLFAEAAPYVAPGDTLLDALQYGGGRGIEGATRILLRAATAMVLNSTYDAAHDNEWHIWPWEYSADRIAEFVNEALATGDRDTILWWAEWFDVLNNLGCPLERAEL